MPFEFEAWESRARAEERGEIGARGHYEGSVEDADVVWDGVRVGHFALLDSDGFLGRGANLGLDGSVAGMERRTVREVSGLGGREESFSWSCVLRGNCEKASWRLEYRTS